MERFYGFDLGDAESAVTRLNKTDQEIPEVISVQEAGSFITAWAMRRDGKLLIGEGACYEPDALKRQLRFKSRFLTDPSARGDIKSFAAGVLGELLLQGDLVRGDDQCFYVGCPAGWDKAAREEYREIFESAGYPPLKVVSESRAALVSACRSRHLQVGYDILSRPVLVVDIGSSTTDFAYIMSGKEVELKTGGEVSLGGGIMDEILLEESVAASFDPERIRKIFSENEAWRTYCEFAARRLKEKYFSDEEYWKKEPLTQTVTIRAQLIPARLKLSMSPEIADKLINKKVDRLGRRSFKEVFTDSLRQVRQSISDRQPELIFMTGGVSRLAVIRDWCREIFPEAVVICGSEPEFSVAKGLAYCGKIDEELREFKADIAALIDSTAVEDLVEKNIDVLYRSTVDNIVDPILEKVALPVIDRWRDGAIDRLADIDQIMEKEIDEYLHSAEGRELLARSVAAWLKSISYGLEEHTMPICVRHNVPYSALSLNTYLSLSDIDIRVEAKSLFAVEEITWLIDAIVSVVVGLLCGGSGLALIASGIQGILIGFVISALVLALGKDHMQGAFLKMNIPHPLRRLMPKSYLRSRADKISSEVKKNLYEKLEHEKNEEITEHLISDISQQIERCLTKMAEVVEIPLG
ncbi:MAG: Hsp70 family protein [Lachnospiraceae bacterium]|nr:Hsp70 family protein [Lachnospiraceae bacterium]